MIMSDFNQLADAIMRSKPSEETTVRLQLRQMKKDDILDYIVQLQIDIAQKQRYLSIAIEELTKK